MGTEEGRSFIKTLFYPKSEGTETRKTIFGHEFGSSNRLCRSVDPGVYHFLP